MSRSSGEINGMRKFHESLCDWYNNVRRQPGYNPYQVAAESRKRFVSAHVRPGDFHGRHSRTLMNFIVEQEGKPPSAVTESALTRGCCPFSAGSNTSSARPYPRCVGVREVSAFLQDHSNALGVRRIYDAVDR